MTQQAGATVRKYADLTAADVEKQLDRIVRIRASLVMTTVFFGSLILRLKLVQTKGEITTTMAVDGRHMFWYPPFVETLTDVELRGVLVHEVLHCALEHMVRRREREHRRWNVACDHAINLLVTKAGYTLPKDALLDQQYEGLTAEEIYPLLPEGAGGAPSGPGSGQGWGEVLDAPAGEAKQVEVDWKVATLEAAHSEKLSRGTLPAYLERLVEEVARAKVDWRSCLWRFIQRNAKNDYSWRKPSRRHAGGRFVLPSLHSEEMPPLVICIDTSGSIGGEELSQFLAECSAVHGSVRPQRTYVVSIDADVSNVEEFGPNDLLDIHPSGGGGTDFRPAFEWVEQQGIEPACLIYLTDTYGTFPEQEPPYPVLWAVTARKECPFGETVYLLDD